MIQIINERLEVCLNQRLVYGKSFENDSWLLVIESKEMLFKVILTVLEHNTGYEGYENIPLEIALGMDEYPMGNKIDGSLLACHEETIGFLKSYITNRYRAFYKEKTGQSIHSTFIILTQQLYDDLEPLDQEFCTLIESKVESESAFLVADMERLKTRGKVYRFLEKINRSGSKLYDRIDSLYVAPLEFDDIKNSLENKRLVFITGTPEYGKTYTAIRLLWEYFFKGYTPIWIEGGDEIERQYVRRRLEEIEKDLAPKNVVYYEDPFGKTKYERRESLERDIGNILNSINNVDDVYVIITSREEVFKQFEKERLSSKAIKEFEKQLNIKKPSYNYEKRLNILDLWAKSKSCKWLNIPIVRSEIATIIKTPNKLPTPLSIRSFVISSVNLVDRIDLIKEIDEKSEETARSFAAEVKNMTQDKQLFLSFLFVLRRIKKSKASKLYEKIALQIPLENYQPFDDILSWFHDDKIELGKGGKMLSFSHPSYLQSIDHLLKDDHSSISFSKQIFFPVLTELANTPKMQQKVPNFIAAHYNTLNDGRDLLFSMSEQGITATSAIRAIRKVYTQSPIAENLIRHLSKKKETAEAVGKLLNSHFVSFEPNFRNEILLNLIGMSEADVQMAAIISWHYFMLPPVFKTKMFELGLKPECGKIICRNLILDFRKLKPDMIDFVLKLAEHPEIRMTTVKYALANPKAINLCDKLKEIVFGGIAEYLESLSCSNSYKSKRLCLNLIFKYSDSIDRKSVIRLLEKLSNDTMASIGEQAEELLNEINSSV